MVDAAHAANERVFPTRYWTPEARGEGLPAELVRLAGAPPTWRERLAGPWRAPEARLARILRALVAGVRAETGGIHERADFYFETAFGEFERLCADDRGCRALSELCAAPDIRVAIAHELFLHVHAGFINGYLQLSSALEPGTRALKHAAWAERLLKFAGLSTEAASATRAWLRTLEIGALQRAGRQQDALAACERALERSSPSSFKDAYIHTLYELTTAALSGGESDADKQKDASVLAGALARFRSVFANLSDRPVAWERLAELHWRRIAALSDAEAPGSRIAIMMQAVDADPFNLVVHSLDVQSRLALADLQEQMARLEAQAAAEGKVLNEKGMSLRASIVNGFDQGRSYLASGEAEALQHASRLAWSSEVWTGLQLPESDGWQQQSLDLIDAIGTALSRCSLDTPAFTAALAEAMRTRPGLQALDASIISMGLRMLRGVRPARDVPADPGVPDIIQASEPLPVAENSPVPGSEDFADWFFSRHGRMTRWAVAAALVCLTTAAALTGYSTYVESNRHALFPLVMAAARENDSERVAVLAAQFLTRRPLTGRDHLDQAVEQAYAEALVNLFARSPGEPSRSLVRSAEKYRQLVGEPEEKQP